MVDFNIKEHPHTRLNILTGEWVLVSPHRTKRPWQGKVEAASAIYRPLYDLECYLCPGNKRADNSATPKYSGPYAFTNDYSALLENTPRGDYNSSELLKAESQAGICRVICFSPFLDLEDFKDLEEEVDSIYLSGMRQVEHWALPPQE